MYQNPLMDRCASLRDHSKFSTWHDRVRNGQFFLFSIFPKSKKNKNLQITLFDILYHISLKLSSALIFHVGSNRELTRYDLPRSDLTKSRFQPTKKIIAHRVRMGSSMVRLLFCPKIEKSPTLWLGKSYDCTLTFSKIGKSPTLWRLTLWPTTLWNYINLNCSVYHMRPHK